MSTQTADNPVETGAITLADGPSLRLAGLVHTSAFADLWEETLPRLSTFAALQGLWRPTLGSTGSGLLVVLPGPATSESKTICGFTVPADVAIGAPLMGFNTAHGPLATLTVDGPWENVANGYQTICQDWLPAHGMRQNGPWFAVFLTNPRSTEPADWKCEVRVPVAPLKDTYQPAIENEAPITDQA